LGDGRACMAAAENFNLAGVLKGHNGWVTSIATPHSSADTQDIIVSGSRDRSLIQWNIQRGEYGYGYPHRSFRGHAHFVSEVVLSSDAQFALSASWDHTLRLWDLNNESKSKLFVGHTHDVTSVAFSSDNRQIVSGSRDRTIKLWNTLAECKHTYTEGGHTDWVSSVRFSPDAATPTVISGGWDKLVKVWNLRDGKVSQNFVGHTGCVNSIAVCPDGSVCGSGGKDSKVFLWDLSEQKLVTSLDAGSSVNQIAFNPNLFWLAAATNKSVRIWDLKSRTVIADLGKNFNDLGTPSPGPKTSLPQAQSLAWSSDGRTLYAGYTDSNIRVWESAR